MKTYLNRKYPKSLWATLSLFLYNSYACAMVTLTAPKGFLKGTKTDGIVTGVNWLIGVFFTVMFASLILKLVSACKKKEPETIAYCSIGVIILCIGGVLYVYSGIGPTATT